MHYLAACLVFKDAASYLDEWIRFHQRVGFEHFYLYDNDSTMYVLAGDNLIQVNGVDSADKCAALARPVLAAL